MLTYIACFSNYEDVCRKHLLHMRIFSHRIGVYCARKMNGIEIIINTQNYHLKLSYTAFLTEMNKLKSGDTKITNINTFNFLRNGKGCVGVIECACLTITLLKIHFGIALQRFRSTSF